jgi:hypothetical protein
MFHLGADDSLIAENVIENHNLGGIAIVDYCLAMAGGPRDCARDPHVPHAFLLDSAPSNNRILRNRLHNNGANPDPASPFAFAASDIALLTIGDN